MRDEVEEFLRRAAQRRAQAEAQRRAQGQPGQPAQQNPNRPPPPPQQQPPPQRLAPLASSLQPAEVVELGDDDLVEATPVNDNSVGERVTSELRRDLGGVRQIRQQVRTLGQEVGLADDKMDAHLQQVFDHQLGSLKKSAISTVEASPSAGGAPPVKLSKLVEMLRSPESLRNAFILQEIFQRPADD